MRACADHGTNKIIVSAVCVACILLLLFHLPLHLPAAARCWLLVLVLAVVVPQPSINPRSFPFGGLFIGSGRIELYGRMALASCALIAAISMGGGARGFSPPVPSPALSRITHSPVDDRFVLNEVATETTQDEAVSDPASIVYYDDFLDPDNPLGVVCARGVCVLPDDGDLDLAAPPGGGAPSSSADAAQPPSIADRILSSYLGPRLLLAFASVLYGTNFPLGAIMNDSLPPSAATSARMLLASLALSPFLFKLEGSLAPTALLCGCFTATGYISQSLSLVDTSPATVAFLGERARRDVVAAGGFVDAIRFDSSEA